MKVKDLQGPNISRTVPIAAAATAATAESVGVSVPHRAVLDSAYFIPASAMSGAASNNRKLDVVNKGAAGAGTAVAATITYTASVDAVAQAQNALTVSATAANVNFAEGDVAAVSVGVNGTGLPCPAGTVVLNFKSR